MEQHPIPQNISSYQFRLVGDMTLKQFFQLAAGVLISLLIYSLPIHPIIKWPFIVFFTIFGAALAFLPFQERPLEQWVIAFFRSIYSPTVFKWKSIPNEDFFRKEPDGTTQAMPAIPAPTTTTQPTNIPFVNSLEETEGKFLRKMAELFNSSSVPTPQPAFAGAGVSAASMIMPSAMAPQVSAPIPTTSSAIPIDSYPLPPAQPQVQPETGTSAPIPQGRPEVNVPQTGVVTMPKMVVEESVPTPAPIPSIPSAPITMAPVAQTLTGEAVGASQAVEFSTDAAAPSMPTIQNTVSGQVIDPEGKMIEGAILEIKDDQGRPVRALRSNKVGHFLTVTPLLNGKYELTTEKEGFVFEPYTLTTAGEIIPPIAIRAKGRGVTTQVLN